LSCEILCTIAAIHRTVAEFCFGNKDQNQMKAKRR